MDFGRSFTYVFEDEKWVQKIFIGGLIFLIPIINIAVLGYLIDTLRRAKEGRVPVLPDWNDFFDHFKNGLLLAAGILVYAFIPILLIVFGVGFSYLKDFFSRGVQMVQPATGLATLLVLFAFLYFIALLLILPAIYLHFASKQSFGALFELGSIFNLIRADTSNYVLCLINILIAGFVSAIVTNIPFIGWILSVFAGFYANLVVAGAIAQYWLIVEGINVLEN
jgi:hypothetical protein